MGGLDDFLQSPSWADARTEALGLKKGSKVLLKLKETHEKNNANFRFAEAESFNQCVNDMYLIELPLLDRSYTCPTSAPLPLWNVSTESSSTLLGTRPYPARSSRLLPERLLTMFL
jgi:hypothetical protein